MKESVIKNAIEEFAQKNSLNTSEGKEILENFLWASVRELRKEDFFLYEQIYSLSTLAQKDILLSRLECEFFDIGTLCESMSEKINVHFAKALEMNGVTTNVDDYFEETMQLVFEDCIDLLIENDFIPNKLKEDIKSAGDRFLKFIVKKLPTLSFSTSAISLPLLSVSLPVTMFVLLGILIASSIYSKLTSSYFGVNIAKEQLELLKSVTDLLNDISKTVKNSTEKFKYRFLITFKNEEKCYRRAGLDPKTISTRFFASIKEDSPFRQLLFFNEADQLDKLRNCFLENFLDRIAIFFDLYFDCLKKSGNWNDIKGMSDDKFIEMFRMKGKLYPICDEYRDNAVEAIRTFENLVDFIFENNKEKKSQWMLLMNRYILDKRAPKEELIKNNRSTYEKDRQSQWTGKYNKLGKNIHN